MRCPDCQKFVSLETELDNGVSDDHLEVSTEGFTLQFEIHIARNCGECGQMLKETTLQFSVDEKPEGWADKVKDLDLNDADVDFDDPEETESGGGRYAKNLIGASVSYKINIGDVILYEGSAEDSVAASEFEECV
jgi:hypothetical protein